MATGAAALLLAGATVMSLTGSVLAAVPTADAASAAIPATYSAGNAAGFRGTYLFTDRSSLAKLYLTLTTTGADANVYFSATRNGANAARFCTVGTVTTTCVFKSVRTNDQFVITAAYSTSAAAVTANFEWSTTGSTGSDGGASHGDTWDDTIQTARLSADANYGGGFTVTSNGTIANGQIVSVANRQAISLANLPAGIPATVLDGPDATGACGTIDCSTQFGEWSEISVGDGQTAFTIVITYYQGTPRAFVHQYVDAAGVTQYEQVNACPKKNPAAAAPCFTWSASTNEATIYTLHNGSWKGL